jgi:hypothetical protein
MKTLYLSISRVLTIHHTKFLSPTLLLIITACLVHNAILRAGWAMDDYLAFENIQLHPLLDRITWSGLNRFPFFSLFILPILLYLPPSLAHLIVISCHTISSILILQLLKFFRLPEPAPMISAIFFLIWPSHEEALFWLVASTIVFGLLISVSGILFITKHRFLPGVLAVSIGMSFSEGLVLPIAFLQAITLLYLKIPNRLRLAIMSTSLLVYGCFQLIRKIVSRDNKILQYSINLDINLAINNTERLIWMAFGQASSQDVAWVWSYSIGTDVTRMLPPYFWLVALILSSFLSIFIIVKYNRVIYIQSWTTMISIAVVGFLSSMVVFMIVSGNAMQTRYTYTGVAYLSVALGLFISFLLQKRQTTFIILGLGISILLGSWGIYRTWSVGWANWYPATKVSHRIINDIRNTYRETQTKKIFLLNEPKSVGSAYALTRDWAYRSVGHQIDPGLDVSADDLTNKILKPSFKVGSRFSEQPCVFLGWVDGHRVVSREATFSPKHVVLDCTTGIAMPNDPQPEPLTIDLQSTSQILSEFPLDQ